MLKNNKTKNVSNSSQYNCSCTAGSILKYDNIKGIAAPKVPAKIRLKSIAKAMIEPNK